MNTALIVIGGVAAAVLGAWLADLFRRARPQVIPTSMRRTIDVVPHGSVVSPNSDLLTALSEHPFFESPPFEGIGKVDERDYVTYLTEIQEHAQEILRLHIPAIVKRAEQLQTRLAADDLDGVAHIWIDSQLLWIYAEGGYIRQEFTLPPEIAASDGSRDPRSASDAGVTGGGKIDDKEVEFGVSPAGTYYVRLPGFVQAVRFPARSRFGRSEKWSRELQRRMSQAFVNKDKADLVRVFNFLAGAERYAPELQALSQQVAEELARLTRLSVTALIANTGGTPMSVSRQTCEIELMLSGYAYTVSEDGGVKPRERRDNVTLEMHLLDEDGYPIEPIVIEAGGVRPVRAVYRTALSEEGLAEGGTLYDLLSAALQGAERNWRVRVDVVLQRNAATTIESRKLSFRDTHVMETDASLGRVAMRRETRQGLKRLLEARDTELSEVRAELANTRAALSHAQKQAAELYEVLKTTQVSTMQKDITPLGNSEYGIEEDQSHAAYPKSSEG